MSNYEAPEFRYMHITYPSGRCLHLKYEPSIDRQTCQDLHPTARVRPMTKEEEDDFIRERQEMAKKIARQHDEWNVGT